MGTTMTMPCLLRDSCISFVVGPSGMLLDRLVPARALLGAEVRAVEDLLHAEDLHALRGGVFNQLQVLLDVEPLYLFDGRVRGRGVCRLYESAFDCARHKNLR